jgi:hypothetical protein
MKFFEQIYRDLLLEGKQEALAKWKQFEEAEQYVELFMNKRNGIRLKVSSPYNDIDFWHSNKTFEEFKEFIDIFNSKRQLKNLKKYEITVSDDGKSKKIDEIDDYEIWEINSADSAKQIGRFYKGKSAKWCICTDNGDYYWNNYHKNDTFYFLIRKNPKNDEFDKLAFEFKANDEVKIWDLNNRKNTFDNQKVISYMCNNFVWKDRLTDAEKYFLNPISIKENSDGTVNVYGSIYLDELPITEFPWKDKFKVKELFGSLYIQFSSIKSLKNCPEIIHGDFDYTEVQLENLENFPKVNGNIFN